MSPPLVNYERAAASSRSTSMVDYMYYTAIDVSLLSCSCLASRVLRSMLTGQIEDGDRLYDPLQGTALDKINS
jgi:hypothetical protein